MSVYLPMVRLPPLQQDAGGISDRPRRNVIVGVTNDNTKVDDAFKKEIPLGQVYSLAGRPPLEGESEGGDVPSVDLTLNAAGKRNANPIFSFDFRDSQWHQEGLLLLLWKGTQWQHLAMATSCNKCAVRCTTYVMELFLVVLLPTLSNFAYLALFSACHERGRRREMPLA